MEQALLARPAPARAEDEDTAATPAPAQESPGNDALLEAQTVRDEVNRILKRLRAHAPAMSPEQARAVRRKLSEVKISLAFVYDVVAELPHDSAYLGHLAPHPQHRERHH